MAVIEIGAAAVGDYASERQRNAAIIGTSIHSSVDLLCFAAGEAIMAWSAASLPHPLAKLAGMGLGLAVMSAGGYILGLLGLDEAVERWTSFPPGEVTHVHQRIAKVLDEYRIIIGSAQLAQRSEQDLGALGFKSPDDVQWLASRNADQHAAEVRSKESELTDLFEDAYKRARSSWVGLQILDEQAAEFTRLRGVAMQNRKDPRHADLDARWQRIDERLKLGDADRDTIWEMEQWVELESHIEKLRGLLSPEDADIDFKEIFETMDETQMMLENARYRIDSASQGKFRPAPLIPKDSPVYTDYVERLIVYERSFATLYQDALRLSGGSPREESAPAITE